MKEQFDSRDVARHVMALILGLQEATPKGRAMAVIILKKALWRANAALKRDLEEKAKADEANK